ncbi:hydroxyproline dehydrogenase-like [Dendronephthya gigantea]|uniref:hydroxyproline dehydrogenase-like n=1 Tax=Dendronephthya gigantea TaxID=151771 RepID=UPI00106C126B|nr:hydroxyproline dehydrogenase-like [Dendronephthya gigantea]
MLQSVKKFLEVKINLRNVARFRCVLVENTAKAGCSSNRELPQLESDKHQLHFNDSRLSTESKSSSDILKAFVILKLCTINTLVDNSEKLLAWCKGIFGDQFYEKIIKRTIYKQFVAGETEQDVKFIASNLQKSNINCMFCIPSEDITADNLLLNAHDVELLYDTNLNLMLDCIDITASLGCFAQTKITPFISSDAVREVTDLLSDYKVNHDKRPSELSVTTWSKALDSNHESKFLPNCNSATNKHVKKSLTRLDNLANHAQERGVKLMLDAEYLSLQAGMDLIILAMQQKYNQQNPIVYNTYQCYRKDTPARIQNDVEYAEKHNFKIACKLVRGAYMEHERERAAKYGYEDPICDSIEETERNYKLATDLMLPLVAKGKAEVMFATHNEDCVEYGVKRIKELGVKPDDGSVSFGQLYGMCDHVSYGLGNAGFIVHKSVPYGTVESSILYLLRRAQENKSMLKRTAKESAILLSEMKRRAWRMFGYV